MRDIAKALSLLIPTLDQISSISGVPGMSLGVFHEGEVVFRHNYGHRDAWSSPATSQTIYPIGSLTKSFTALLYGSLVADNLLDWDAPMRTSLPEFRSREPEINNYATAADLLSHRTGIPGYEFLYWASPLLLNDSAIIPMFASFPRENQFRQAWLYNNLGYGLVSLQMSHVTGQDYDKLIQARILEPLNMTRTGTKFDKESTEDVASVFLVTEDKEAIKNLRPFFLPGSAMIAAGGLASCVDDLLSFYQLLTQQLSEENESSDVPGTSPRLKRLETVVSPHAFIRSQRSGNLEQTYAMGWIRTQLPAELGIMGLNSGLVQEMPVVGRGSGSRLALYHQGNLPGATSAVYLFPETNSGVVVLANAFGLSDVPDWISQAIISTLFDDERSPDSYVKLAQEAVTNNQQYLNKTAEILKSLKRPGPNQEILGQYSGKYLSTSNPLFLEIYEFEGHLRVAFQGLPEQEFLLEWLYEDVFSWFPSSLEMMRRGRYPLPVSYYLLAFERDALGTVYGLRWPYSEDESTTYIFSKTSESQLNPTMQGSWELGSFGFLLILGVVVVLYRRF
ncbi:putative D-aminoacylase [Nemania abortiva]|nr:putative D-aminoacylase [Nemania abortiva]